MLCRLQNFPATTWRRTRPGLCPAVVMATFPRGVTTFLGIKAERWRLKSVAALMRPAVQELRQQLPGHPFSMRAMRGIHKWRTGVPEFPVPAKLAVRHSSAASSGLYNGLSHVSWESQPTTTNAWATPHNAAASSMHGDPWNTICAADCASRVGSPEDKSEQALPECCGGPFI